MSWGSAQSAWSQPLPLPLSVTTRRRLVPPVRSAVRCLTGDVPVRGPLSATFRLWFVPPVPQSDYSRHLLGPDDWTKTNPPHVGSPVAQLPDYYGSVNLLFTMG